MKELYIVVNEDVFFLSHRKEIAISAKSQGFNVTIITKNTGHKKEIIDLGLNFIDLPINPTGENIIQELKTFKFLYKTYKKNKDVIVHHVGLKNILWGGLAAKLLNVKGVVNAVSGLGILFSNENLSFKTKMIIKVLKFSHSRNNLKVIFQNNEDMNLFLSNGIITKEKVTFIKGSGVNLNIFKYKEESSDLPIKVIFTGRMVEEKGVMILIKAAKLLKDQYFHKVKFLLCGGLSSNPKAIKEKDLVDACEDGYIEWLGFRSDIKKLLEESNIVAFPSYYREGVPKSLIEATAIGRPIITTNSIGCKDTVEDGYNGFLTPIKDYKSVAEKLKILIDDKELRIKMGKNSRAIAERDFSLDSVIKKHLKVYNDLL